jgi:hypothetical protein
MRIRAGLTDRRMAWVALAALAPAVVRAELLDFARGGRVQLPAAHTPEGTIRVEAPDGPLVFTQGDFRAIVPGCWPEHDWPSRRDAALAGGPEVRYTAAWWALENGLTRQAEDLVREAYRVDPCFPPAARMIAVLERLERPVSDPDLDPARRALGGPFAIACSEHVVLLHQHTGDEAAERLELLESVVRSFYLLFAAHGFELAVPRERLVAAWFAQQTDYLVFLHREGADAFRTTLGYYHPTLGIVATFDARTVPAQQQARAELAAAEVTLERIPAGEHRDRLGRDLIRRRLLLELQRRSIELGTAAHELIHLLVETSALAPRHDDFPFWLHEGLAAQFEVVRGGRWAGFGRAHDLRLPDWRRIDPPPRLAPLLRDTDFGRGYQRDAYAAAWALVYYLRKQHPAQFVTFLDLLRTPDAEARPRADRTVALFQAAFGADLTMVEADWHHLIDGLKTPLEAAH